MESVQKTTRRPLKTHFDAVVYFFTRMDAEMISDLLDSEREYQGFVRHVFIRKLGDLFHDLIALGDTKLVAMVEDGPLPVDGNYGVTFEGNNSSLYLDVVFEVDEIGYITDIYEVINVLDDEEEIEIYSKKQRVYIDQFLDTDFDLSCDEEEFGDDSLF